MTATEFRGLKLMMLEKYHAANTAEEKMRILAWTYGENALMDAIIRGFAKEALEHFGIDVTNFPNVVDANFECGLKVFSENAFNDEDQFNNVLAVCFNKAFQDALPQGTPRREMSPRKERCLTLFRENDAFRTAVKELFKVSTQSDFDLQHQKLASLFCDEGDINFTFGNAQKLINMMLKYCYMLSLYFSSSNKIRIRRFVRKINRISHYLHVPIDSIMLGVLRGDRSGGLIGFRERPTTVVRCGDEECTWSQIKNDQAGYDAYLELQKLCRQRACLKAIEEGANPDELYPIAWECDEWLRAQ